MKSIKQISAILSMALILAAGALGCGEVKTEASTNAPEIKVPEGEAIDDAALVDYLRQIPEANIGDFGTDSSRDEFTDVTEYSAMRELTLLRDGELYARYLIPKDFSAVFKEEGEDYKLIYGTVEKMLDQTSTYTIYNEETGEDEEHEDKIIGATILAGDELEVGMTSEVLIYAPVDLTESITLKSSDESILKVDGANVEAVAPGEVKLTVDFVYGGFKRTDELSVIVK